MRTQYNNRHFSSDQRVPSQSDLPVFRPRIARPSLLFALVRLATDCHIEHPYGNTMVHTGNRGPTQWMSLYELITVLICGTGSWLDNLLDIGVKHNNMLPKRLDIDSLSMASRAT